MERNEICARVENVTGNIVSVCVCVRRASEMKNMMNITSDTRPEDGAPLNIDEYENPIWFFGRVLRVDYVSHLAAAQPTALHANIRF